jgi:hypothetical protein
MLMPPLVATGVGTAVLVAASALRKQWARSRSGGRRPMIERSPAAFAVTALIYAVSFLLAVTVSDWLEQLAVVSPGHAALVMAASIFAVPVVAPLWLLRAS